MRRVGRRVLAAASLAVLMLCSHPVMAANAPAPANNADAAKKADDASAGKTTAATVSAGDVKHGEQIFKSICTHCHRTDYETSPVGAPGLRDVMERHTPEWEFQWLLSPAAFAKKDETAKALTESNPYGLVMPTIPEMADPQNRRDVIEFLKTLKGK